MKKMNDQTSIFPIGPKPTLEEVFYNFHKKLVYFCFQFVQDKDLAEDIVQEVFIQFAQKEELLEHEIPYIQNYLFKAVKNRSINALRDQKHNLGIDDGMAEISNQDQSIVQRMIHSEVLNELYAAMEALPEGCRRISTLGFLEGKSNQEIADQLGVSINTVKTQKQRGLKLLRLRLNPEVLYVLVLLINC
ncbi:RNA polymerase sigma-70 factor [Echinicola strongylocentroti]|uniref:RNA polymerase sigma-70 factor n=1 Tax=Echinicola strongylocentroti TaxID=1795355 RepID=A0A2Z4IEB4_9BACT|nr:RNA polymerase sigma-70 factor [Echinicola strongylocentroti]AWW28763.1 RNA polymerase sigma-70 factor [Echinicola strongylocentroti]